MPMIMVSIKFMIRKQLQLPRPFGAELPKLTQCGGNRLLTKWHNFIKQWKLLKKTFIKKSSIISWDHFKLYKWSEKHSSKGFRSILLAKSYCSTSISLGKNLQSSSKRSKSALEKFFMQFSLRNLAKNGVFKLYQSKRDLLS